MAASRSVPVVCTSLCLLLVVFVSRNSALASSGGSATTHFTCDQVRQSFEGNFGSPENLHSHPRHETETSICRHGKPGSHYTCCSVATEEAFADLAENRLKKNIRTVNHSLKKHINNILARYQDGITQLTNEAQNRTLASLTRLQVPVSEHGVVRKFFTALHRMVENGTADSGLDDIVREFFTNLFPPVFNYVLSVQGQGERLSISQEYQGCLRSYADQIQPFGNQPEVLLKDLRRSIRHAVVFQGAMKTFVNTMTATEAATVDRSCRHALLRMQVCPGCRGVNLKRSPVKPCRGMCLNVMRGCLASISRISSFWDQVIVAFENLQMGTKGQHELQKMLMYLDMNVTDSITMAMEDSARIYDEVKVKCQNVPREDPHKVSSAADARSGMDAAAEPIPPRSPERLGAHRQEVKALIKYLQDSRGMFNRMADSLCQNEAEYSQDMQSATCWNGTTVGRYMEQVPEVSVMSQVQSNKEVQVHMRTTDDRFLEVTENLARMRQTLSGLENSDLMQSDSVVPREGSGAYGEVLFDDEDMVNRGSGSGSGSGDGSDEEEEETTTRIGDTIRPRPTPKPSPPPSGSSCVVSTSLLLLFVCVLSQRIWAKFL